MTQLALNAKISNITKIILFFVNYNKEFNLFKKEQKHLLAQLVKKDRSSTRTKNEKRHLS